MTEMKTVLSFIRSDRKVMVLFWSLVICLAFLTAAAGILVRMLI